MANEPKKRFIAGAVCPRCGELDKIKMFHLDGKDYRECVNCDFSDQMHFPPKAREIATRVNQVEEEAEKEAQVVKIIPPSR